MRMCHDVLLENVHDVVLPAFSLLNFLLLGESHLGKGTEDTFVGFAIEKRDK